MDNVHHKPSLMRFGTVGLIAVLVGAYVAAVALYASSNTANRRAETPTASDQTSVTLYVDDVQTNYTVLNANLVFHPDLTFWIRKLSTLTKTSVFESDPWLRPPAGRIRRACFPVRFRFR